jgi:hypothetical protein
MFVWAERAGDLHEGTADGAAGPTTGDSAAKWGHRQRANTMDQAERCSRPTRCPFD